MRILTTAGLVVIKDRRLLLAFSKNKQAFYLPGGKADENETTLSALQREIQEELSITLDPTRLSFYTHITAPAFGEDKGVIMEQDCYRYELHEQPNPSAEIGALEWFDTTTYLTRPEQVPGVIRILQLLKEENLID